MYKSVALSVALFFASTFHQAYASLITHEIILDTYQVCFDGIDCSDVDMIENGDLEQYADDFFSVVGLDIVFGDIQVLNYARPENSSIDTRFYDYFTLAGYGQDPTGYTTVPTFFEQSFDTFSLGLGYLGYAGVLVNSVSDYADNMVTFIHELGHNLGLDHYFDYGIGATNNFMDYSACAYSCTITEEQISFVRTGIENNAYSFVHEISNDIDQVSVPEPSTLLLFTFLILFLLIFPSANNNIPNTTDESILV
ncbi:M12 family metallo-peptidase [Thalassotalea sp. G2M2-11]|uniref:M12 family metallo-peptidase n=1 Tax=Thalassotalea sp. G2M2-11 TaxID=2787627 RepID=UPI0019CF9E66|nr:M12 family metallo-peptidase [Thalassotalea sp. G2M2-11]